MPAIHFDTLASLQAALDANAFRFLPAFNGSTFRCADCGEVKPLQTEGCGGTGYGRDDAGKMFCYECGAARTRADLNREGRGVLYMTRALDGRCRVTDWTGKLSLPASYHVGRHNIAGKRYSVRFRMDGAEWSGTTYGDNTQICHVKRLKSR